MKLITAGILAAIFCITCHALESNPEAQLDEELRTLQIEGQDSNTNLISLQFSHTPLSEVLEFFKDKSGTTLNYNEEDIKDCSITAELEDVEWQDALRVILDSVNMTYSSFDSGGVFYIEPQKDEKENTISDAQFEAVLTGQYIESHVNMLKKVLADPEFASALATFDRNYYDALIAKGFSETQAFKLVLKFEANSLDNLE